MDCNIKSSATSQWSYRSLSRDIHLEGFVEELGLEGAIKQEENFLIAIEKPLTKFLSANTKESEFLVVEKIVTDLLPVSHLFQDILLQGGMAAIPLITRLNVLAHPKIPHPIKLAISCIDKCKLQPTIEIIPYDIRSKYPELCKMSFPNTQQEYNLYCRALIFHKKLFKDDIQKQINDTDIYDSIFSDFIAKKGNFLIEGLDNRLELEHFFTYVFADFGYLTFVAQNTHKNITLYLGIVHCHNLAQDLERIGYKTIFEKGVYDERDLCKNIIPGHRSQEEYQEFFFTTGPV